MKKTISLQLLRDGILQSIIASWFCTNTVLLFFNKHNFSTLDYVREISLAHYFYFWAIVFAVISYLYFRAINPILKNYISGFGIFVYAIAIIIKGVVFV